MEHDLTYLIDNAIGCRNSLVLAADKFVGWLEGIRDAAAKCEQDLKPKQAMADAEINRRRSEIEELKDQCHKLERELAMLQKQIKDDRRKAEYELEMAQRRIDDANQQVVRIKAEALKLFEAA
jgi:septal ring factor EnvC (AmiA/AmiB activator)